MNNTSQLLSDFFNLLISLALFINVKFFNTSAPPSDLSDLVMSFFRSHLLTNGKLFFLYD